MLITMADLPTKERAVAKDDTSTDSVDKEISETETLEELIREETRQQLEAAWRAQQRLARASFAPQKEGKMSRN